jgi:hypothetical protein
MRIYLLILALPAILLLEFKIKTGFLKAAIIDLITPMKLQRRRSIIHRSILLASISFIGIEF